MSCFTSVLRLVLPRIPQSLCKELHSQEREANSTPFLITGCGKNMQGNICGLLREIFVWIFTIYWGVLCWHLGTAAESKKTSQQKMQDGAAAIRKIVFRIDDPVWHWSPLHEKRWWENPTGEAGPMLGQMIWFPCLTDRNPVAFLRLSSDILTWSQSINQWGSVFILMRWECWGKHESIIHNSLNVTDDEKEIIAKVT